MAKKKESSIVDFVSTADDKSFGAMKRDVQHAANLLRKWADVDARLGKHGNAVQKIRDLLK